VARSGTALAQLTQAQHRAIGGVFARDSAPVWSAEAWAQGRAGLPGRARAVALDRWADIARYLADPSSGIVWHVGALGLVAFGLLGLRRRTRQLAATPEGAPAATAVFDRPYAATLVIALLVVATPWSPLPLTVLRLFEVVGLVPVIALSRLAEDRRRAPALYTLWVLFAVDNLREIATGTPVLEQVILALELLAGIAVLGHALRRGGLRPPSAVGVETISLTAFRLGGGLVMIVFAIALVASVLGYMRLARLLTAGVLGSGVLALTLYAAVRVLHGVAALALRVWPLQGLHLVQHHRDLLERRAHRVLVAAAIGAWVTRTLNYVGLFQPALSAVGSALAVPLGRGSIQISVGNILEFVLTIWVAYLVSAFIRFVLGEDVYPRTRLTRGISYAISSLLNYVIIAFGFVLAVGALGFDVTRVTVLVGAFGVGIGFGLQSVVNNFVSGLILLFERPIHVGDIVEVGTLTGEVVRIGIRASIVRTGNGAEIIVPNAQLVTERVTNWTLSDRTRRVDLPVSVSYGSPPEQVVEALEAVARAHPQIMQSPPPQAVFTAFGDSSIDFELRAWTNRSDRWPKIRTELAAAIYAALPAAGMTFPFPQREIRLLREHSAGAVGASTASPNPANAGDGAPATPGERR
jgi:small-conductance mechanosensitive channel